MDQKFLNRLVEVNNATHMVLLDPHSLSQNRFETSAARSGYKPMRVADMLRAVELAQQQVDYIQKAIDGTLAIITACEKDAA